MTLKCKLVFFWNVFSFLKSQLLFVFKLHLLFPLRTSYRYELLHVLNFDPVRRRMSVIVRSISGELKVTVNVIGMLIMQRWPAHP